MVQQDARKRVSSAKPSTIVTMRSTKLSRPASKPTSPAQQDRVEWAKRMYEKGYVSKTAIRRRDPQTLRRPQGTLAGRARRRGSQRRAAEELRALQGAAEVTSTSQAETSDARHSGANRPETARLAGCPESARTGEQRPIPHRNSAGQADGRLLERPATSQASGANGSVGRWLILAAPRACKPGDLLLGRGDGS